MGFGWNGNCMPVTGKDGKTVWIFRLEDLREIVSPEVYEVIESLIKQAQEDEIGESYKEVAEEQERVADGYFQLCQNCRDDFESILDYVEKSKRLNKDTLYKKIDQAYQNLYNNL